MRMKVRADTVREVIVSTLFSSCLVGILTKFVAFDDPDNRLSFNRLVIVVFVVLFVDPKLNEIAILHIRLRFNRLVVVIVDISVIIVVNRCRL